MDSLIQPRIKGEVKILDFDMEVRRSGFHTAGRYKPDGCEPVVIAASWLGEEKVSLFSLTPGSWKKTDARKMLEDFVKLYNEAQIVTGHYVLGFDLPIINGSLLEFGYPPLEKKLVYDTKVHLKSIAGLSASQENLGALLELDSSKFHMNDVMWRALTRLTTEGIVLAEERVTADILMHKELYHSLLPWLDGPTYWNY